MAAEALKIMPWGQPSINRLSGDRLHLSHGPIDLIMRAEGDISDVQLAYGAAHERFQTILTELVEEISELRKPLREKLPHIRSPVAKRMVEACWPYRQNVITPMAAVAGSVADEIKAAMLVAAPKLQTLYVNNGGDIAVFVAKGRKLKIGLVADLAQALPEGVITIDYESCIGGIATSGWRGRSFSRGIADAVTVLARSAADADAAATMIANAVDVDSPNILRSRASDLDPDSDLGSLLVTTDVGQLHQTEIDQALSFGEKVASVLVKSAHIQAYFIALQGNRRLSEGAALRKLFC